MSTLALFTHKMLTCKRSACKAPARNVLIILIFLLSAVASAAPVHWQDWSPAVFQQASREHKLVLLDLAAVWCHWCHVMDKKTYADPRIADYLNAHYIAVRVDQDARPDLANRYRNYGWPATVLFTADGTELVKRAGYIDARPFLAILKQTVANPTPGQNSSAPVKTFSGSAQLGDTVRRKLLTMHRSSYDKQLGGLRLGKKFLDPDSTEERLVQAWLGDQQEGERARRTLDAARDLIDPVWGGAYQYSTHGDWSHPHFEKIMAVQNHFLRLYSLAYAQWQRPEDLASAQAVARYLANFLTGSNGAFYTSQDADRVPGQHADDYFALHDKARRALGLPRIDTHQYARENGWAIQGLALLYQVSGDRDALKRAEKAAHWVLTHRALKGGGFRHGAKDIAGPYLGDTLAMGQACLALYRADANRQWLHCATAAADFIGGRFQQPGAGFLTAAPSPGDALAPVARTEENIHMTRFANLLYRYTADNRYRKLAEHGMRYLATPAVATATLEEAGILLADRELGQAPRHFTVVGAKSDANAGALYQVALRQPGAYKRVEWWDRSEGPLPDPEVQYPATGKSAAYVCTDRRCSLPSFNVARYRETILRLITHGG